MSHVTKNWFTTNVNVGEGTPVVMPFRGGKRKGGMKNRHMK
jgi:hypothetical protein